MATRTPSHRNEATGNAALDRIQNNVRELVARVAGVFTRISRAHGTDEMVDIVIPDQNITLTSEQFAGGFWRLTGTLTAQRTIRVPRASRTTAWGRPVLNDTLGGFTVHLLNEDGSTSIAAGSGGVVVTGPAGPETWA